MNRFRLRLGKALNSAHGRMIAAAMAALLVTAGGVKLWPVLAGAEIVILHVPSVFDRRVGDFTANVTGTSNSRTLEYSVNGRPWRPLNRDGVRVHDEQFTVELAEDDLNEGDNMVAIRSRGLLTSRTREVWFRYDNRPVTLPVRRTWTADASLDVQDGAWEVFDSGAMGWRVRPKPGFEDYDRLLVISGAFAGARRITTDMVFHGSTHPGKPYGFGVLPLWGGRSLAADGRSRLGWAFSIAWYYSYYDGFGIEFSTKDGDHPPDWVSSYRNQDIRPGIRYRLVIEAWPETNAAGQHVRYRQRMLWHAEDEPQPEEWLELSDHGGAPLPASEYAVALIAHRSRVDFGPVAVEPMTPPKKYTSALLIGMPQ